MRLAFALLPEQQNPYPANFKAASGMLGPEGKREQNLQENSGERQHGFGNRKRTQNR
jgi:hypothetical protein